MLKRHVGVVLLTILLGTTTERLWSAPLVYAPAAPDNPLKGFIPYPRTRSAFPHSMVWDYTKLSEVMTGPAACGPVTLAFCQDVQAEAFDWPEEFFAPKVWRQRRPEGDARPHRALPAGVGAAVRGHVDAGHAAGQPIGWWVS